MRPSHQLAAAQRHADELATALERLVTAKVGVLVVEAHPGHPRAQVYDREARAARKWCDVHDRDVQVCLRADLDCRGTPLADRTDPTGEAACGPNPADAAMADITAILADLQRAVGRVRRLTAGWLPIDPTVAKAITDAEIDSSGDCESCQRVGAWAEVLAFGDVKGNLEHPMGLCRWCYDFVGRRGELPTRDQLRRHHRGERVFVGA